MMKCDKDVCISQSDVCDGVVHCQDSVDEDSAYCGRLRSKARGVRS